MSERKTIIGLKGHNTRLKKALAHEIERCNGFAMEAHQLRRALEYTLDSAEIEKKLPEALIQENEQMRRVIAAHADLWEENEKLRHQVEQLERYIDRLHGEQPTIKDFAKQHRKSA